MAKPRRALIHLPMRRQPEAEERLAAHFRKLLGAHAEDIAGQAARLYGDNLTKAGGRVKQISQQLSFDWSDAAPEDDIGAIAEDASSAALDTFSASIAIDDSVWKTVNQAAVDWAKGHAGELITLVSDSTREFVRAQVAQALEEGWSVAQLKREIVDGYAFSPDRALNIARTEVTNASNQGSLIAAQASDMGMKGWLANDKSCDDCSENEDAGMIPIGDEFPSGHSAPGAHTCCSCGLMFAPATGTAPEEDDGANEEAA